MTTANHHPDDIEQRPPVVISLDLSRVATDEAIITADDWAAIPRLLGLPEVNAEHWAMHGPRLPEEYVRRDGKWRVVYPSGRWAPANMLAGIFCDLALPLLTARDTRLPEVG
jgi:hypothetical protein